MASLVASEPDRSACAGMNLSSRTLRYDGWPQSNDLKVSVASLKSMCRPIGSQCNLASNGVASVRL